MNLRRKWVMNESALKSSLTVKKIKSERDKIDTLKQLDACDFQNVFGFLNYSFVYAAKKNSENYMPYVY